MDEVNLFHFDLFSYADLIRHKQKHYIEKSIFYPSRKSSFDNLQFNYIKYNEDYTELLNQGLRAFCHSDLLSPRTSCNTVSIPLMLNVLIMVF